MSRAEYMKEYRQRRRDEGRPLPPTSKEVKARYKQSHRKEVQKAKRAYAKAKASLRPFVGCDGEGCGVDEMGRQHYQLFRMGERELFTGRPLQTAVILDFICDAPPRPILVGFAFGYDVTMILRDLPLSQQKRLFEPKSFEPGHSPYVWFRDFDIDYLPRNYLKVRRVKIVHTPDGEKRVAIKGSQRTIYETFGFFQKSFLKAISDFSIPTDDETKIIAKNKAARSSFKRITPGVRAYCALECDLLARLMEQLRTYCFEADIRPRTWSGAGKLASALHAKHNTLTAALVRDLVSPDVLVLASDAYYGGRFEITRTGRINERIYEYDINSAYPAAMPNLPCLVHGRFKSASGPDLRSESKKARPRLFLASVSFSASKAGRDHSGKLNGLPIRTKTGTLHWPDKGSGTYWSPEILSAAKLGQKIRYKEGFIYERNCDCKPFEWVGALYDYRKSIGKSGAGYPIKIAINSLYGKLAQRLGNGRYANTIHAGLITAHTRAMLNDAIAQAVPGSVVMLATDAIYSTSPIDGVDVGPGLGQWEGESLDELFVVQPGLYWDPSKRKRKSRGLPGKFFE